MMKFISKYLSFLVGEETDQQKFFKVVIPSFIVHGIAAILAITLVFVLTRNMGAQQYGIFTYAFAIAGLLANFSSYGINVMAVRETSALLSQNKIGLWKGLQRWTLKNLLLTGTSITMAVAVFIFIGTYYFHFFKETPFTLPILCACVSVPLIGLINYYSGLLRGRQRIVFSMLPDNVIKPFTFLVMLVIGILLFGRLNATNAIFLNIIATAIGTGIALFAFLRMNNFKNAVPEYNQSAWRKTFWSFALLTGISSLGTRIDILMLGVLKNAPSVGIYGAADKVSEYLTVFFSVMNMIIVASVSKLHALNEKVKLQRMITKTIRWVFICTVPFYIGILLFNKWIMLFFGPAFETGQHALLILASAQLLNIAFGPVGLVSIMTGNERINTFFAIGKILLNIILNLIFVPYWGLNGTALATIISVGLWNIGMFITIKKKISISTWIFG
jgi:O-antigen/teichoic acid export membrane protein